MDLLAAQLSVRPPSAVRAVGIEGNETPHQISDAELLERIRLNDGDALGCLFRRYGRLVHGIGRRILRDAAEADDFVQDVFLYIYRKCSVYDSAKGSASSWIVQTIYYQALQHRMQLAERNRYLGAMNDEVESVTLGAPASTEYERTLEGMIGRAKLGQMLDSLTEDQWETLQLHFFEGYTLSEIAQRKEQSLGNIRHHFYRGLEKLRSSVFHGERKGRITSGNK